MLFKVFPNWDLQRKSFSFPSSFGFFLRFLIKLFFILIFFFVIILFLVLVLLIILIIHEFVFCLIVDHIAFLILPVNILNGGETKFYFSYFSKTSSGYASSSETGFSDKSISINFCNFFSGMIVFIYLMLFVFRNT